MSRLDELRAYFEADRFAIGLCGITIDEAEDGRAVCSVALEDKHRNALGGAQGGLIFTLADFAFAVAANFAALGTVTSACTINYLKPAKGQRLIAEAVRENAGRSLCLYRVEIRDELDTNVALATVTGFTRT